MISMNVLITKHTATIPLILAVQILTKLMWLQVTGEATVLKKLVTFSFKYIQNQRPMSFKEGKHYQSCMEFTCFLYNNLQWRYLYFTWIPYTRNTERKKESIISDLAHPPPPPHIPLSQFQHPRILTDLFMPSQIQVWACFGSYLCYLHLTLV